MTLVVDVYKSYDINEDAWTTHLTKVSATPETPNVVRKAVKLLAETVASPVETRRITVTIEPVR